MLKVSAAKVSEARRSIAPAGGGGAVPGTDASVCAAIVDERG